MPKVMASLNDVSRPGRNRRRGDHEAVQLAADDHAVCAGAAQVAAIAAGEALRDDPQVGSFLAQGQHGQHRRLVAAHQAVHAVGDQHQADFCVAGVGAFQSRYVGEFAAHEVQAQLRKLIDDVLKVIRFQFANDNHRSLGSPAPECRRGYCWPLLFQPQITM